MHYRAKLLVGQLESTADGGTEKEAIIRALSDSASVRQAAQDRPGEVALVMFRVIPGPRQPQFVICAATLGSPDVVAAAQTLRTFEVISDRANAQAFSAGAALKAFAHVSPKNPLNPK